MTRRAVSLVLAVACILGAALAGVAVGPVAAEPRTIDADHALATTDSVEQFQEEGVASAQLDAFDLTLTVADRAEDVGLNEWTRSSAANTYLRVDYDEEIARTVRIYLPNEFFTPRAHAQFGPEETHNGSATPTMAFEPVGDEYTAVTLTLDGQTDSVFAVSTLTGGVFSVRKRVDKLLNSTAGWSLPSLSGTTEWQYVPQTALSGANVTTTIHVNTTTADEIAVQYDVGTGNETRWLPVEGCESLDAEVCRLATDAGPNGTTITLLSTTSDTPAIRYAANPSASDSVSSIIDELGSLPERIWDDVTGILPLGTVGVGVRWG